MTSVALVQARTGSTRFPAKVLQDLNGTSMIAYLLDRLANARRIDEIVLATSCSPGDDQLAALVEGLGYPVHRGSESDVLDRFYHAAAARHADIVVRITGDCPLVDPGLVDSVVDRLVDTGVDYVSNFDPPTFPDGLDCEALRFTALEIAWREATEPHDREHVTTFVRRDRRFRRDCVRNAQDLSGERWTVDEPEDLVVVRQVAAHFGADRGFPWTAVLEFRRAQPGCFAANRHLHRNEGAVMGSGQKLWKRAKRVIPGGNMLLSKRAEMFLPERWPAYFSSARGCRITDLDGHEYVDMSLMGVGTNSLGYGHAEVDAAVRAVVDAGNMSTLNCPEEVFLGERLVELHPWADMVRLARTGGEANAVAVRIARATAGRDKVAICGYHGWHDWYLAANLGDESGLDGHLMPGLEPRGVPRGLRGTVLPFRYNRIDELERLLEEHVDIGVITMEVSRSEGPAPDFLPAVRRLATARGVVLIFDECTSGFRQTYGGLHRSFGVDPDIALFGKALGNGYAITAVVGRREVMEAAQTSFISSTFWTERIGPAAALKTLEVMERLRSWEVNTEVGRGVMRHWSDLAGKHGLGIRISGLPALATFSFDGPRALAYKTLLTQQMLEAGYLASTGLYACVAHTPDVVEPYVEALDRVFALVRECEDGRRVEDLLRGPVCHAGFKRLN
jgi:glutamate-1-semialdehyde 2,1-aminomutase